MGLDGLLPTSRAPDATIEYLLETIVGEIEDEHDQADRPLFAEASVGVLDADAHAQIERGGRADEL